MNAHLAQAIAHLGSVTVRIDVEHELPTRMELAHKACDGMDRRMRLRLARQVAPVQVVPHGICPILPAVHAIRVDHRHKLEYESVAQCARPRVGLIEDELEEAIEDMRCRDLPRMHAGREQEDWLVRKSPRPWPTLRHASGLPQPRFVLGEHAICTADRDEVDAPALQGARQ